MLLFLTTNMVAVTSRAELGHCDVTSNSSVKFRFVSVKIVLMLLTEKIPASFPVVLGDFGCDVTCQACRENSPRTPGK